MDKVPDFNLIEHDGEFTCTDCGEEVKFLISLSEEEKSGRCKTCFGVLRPDYAQAITDFSELLDSLIEISEQRMSQEDMHELYGNDQGKEDTEE